MKTMRLAATAAISLLLAASALASTGFVPPAQMIEPPYTNDKCLDKCHGEPTLIGSDELGRQVSLHVAVADFVGSTHGQKGVWCIDCHEGANPNEHPRAGYPDVDCRVCHSAEVPEGAFPADGLATLSEKGIQPPPRETHKGEGWAKTRHAQKWFEGNPRAPFCSDCHTAHNVRKATDPASTVSRTNLPDTCGGCHVDQVKVGDEGGALALFRLGGHGKGDLRNRYSVIECVSCHQGEAAHGEEALTEQSCPKCHAVSPEGEGTFHIRPFSDEQPLAVAMRWLYRLGIWGALVVAVLLGIFTGFSGLARSDREE